MEEQKQRPVASDEIDLAQFFRWIGKGFSNLGHSIIGGIAGLRNTFYQNRVFFSGIIVLGLILGALYSELLKKDYYKSSMVLSCDYLGPQILENTIEKFNQLAAETDKENIREILNIDQQTAENIRRFEFRPFVSEEDVVEMGVLREQLTNVTGVKEGVVSKVITLLEIQNMNAYEISVFVYDPGIVKPLEKALVDYFRSNSYISHRIESNRRKLEGQKVKLESELQKLDSLKVVLFQNYQAMAQKSRGSNNVVVGAEEGLRNPLEVFKTDMEMHDQLQKVNEKLFLTPDFEVVDGFTSFKEPDSASLPDVLAISLLLSIVIGYLVLGAYKFDRLLAEYPTKH